MKFTLYALFLLFFSSQIAFAGEIVKNHIPVNPDIEKTPGDFCSQNDRDFKELRYQEKMAYCERNVNQWLKNKIYNAYNIPEKCRHRYTVDHLVPLALGGNNSPENLWPEHVLVKKTRQELEVQLFWEVNKNNMMSQDAVEVLLEEKLKLQLDLSHVEGCG